MFTIFERISLKITVICFSNIYKNILQDHMII